jgi:hypothetical protein
MSHIYSYMRCYIHYYNKGFIVPAGNLSLLQLTVIMSTENAAQGHTMVEKKRKS